MHLRPYKYIMQAVVQRVEGETVIDELTCDPVTLYGAERVREWLDGFPDEVARLDAATAAPLPVKPNRAQRRSTARQRPTKRREA